MCIHLYIQMPLQSIPKLVNRLGLHHHPPRPPTQATYPSNTHTRHARARMPICPILPAADARALVGRCASQERLVSLIQAQVLALMSRDHLQELAHPTEAEAVQLVRAGLYLLLEIGQRVSMQQVHLAARRPPSPAARLPACVPACARPRAPTPGLLPTSRPDIGRLVERRPPHEHRPPRPLRSAPRPAAARAARQDAAEHARAWPPGASSLELMR